MKGAELSTLDIANMHFPRKDRDREREGEKNHKNYVKHSGLRMNTNMWIEQ